jgi:hypothetical protein
VFSMLKQTVGGFRLSGMRKGVKVGIGVVLGLLAVGACEPTWVYLAADGSGVLGETDVGPMCPGPVASGGVCPPGHRAISAIVTRQGWPGIAAIIHTGPEGRFRVRLAPGRYTVHVLQMPGHPPLPYLRQDMIPVLVRSHAHTPVTVVFDSGMR